MNAKGEIEANFDALDELFRAVLKSISNKQIQLAIWTLESFDLGSLDARIIGAASPFASSSSKLAGDGLLISLQPNQVDELIEVFCDRLTYEILHLEIEVEGDVQFAVYDHFCYILFGDQISLALLEEIKSRGVICSYEVYSS